MTPKEKFAALKGCAGALERLEFFARDEPKCPHCGADCNVSEHGHLYEEGEHEVTCPHCDEDFSVSTRVSYSFSTEFQDEEDDV